MASKKSGKSSGKRAGKSKTSAKRRRSSSRAGARGGLIGLGIWFARKCLRLGVFATLFVAAIVGAATAYYAAGLPAADDLLDGRDRGSVTLLDRDGEVFAWRGDQYGGDLRVGQVSPHLKNAIIAAEDRRFYTHIGIDPRGIARAMIANVRAGRLVQGGSTLTQQAAKNVFLSNERSLQRKLKELPVALAMELKYTKDQILSIYLNRVYLGAGTYGFEAASRRYFGKSAREVSPAEAAMLAGLLKAPSRFAPTSDLSVAQGRAAVVIDLMVEEGYLSTVDAAIAKAEPAQLSQAAQTEVGRYFADWVMEAGPGYLTHLTTEDVRIRTTFDRRAQNAAETAMRRTFDSKVKKGSTAQAAIVVMSPDGAVRAMVGGRSYGASQFNRATQAKRQTGSAFKPIVYAAGFEAGMNPGTVMEDAPLRIKNWEPKNYDGTYAGRVTLTDALARSLNTVAVRVSERAGRDRVESMARRMGMVSPLAPGPAVALGTSEATLLEMTGVYATIANRGRSADPYSVSQIFVRGYKEPVMASAEQATTQVMDARHADWLTNMMRSVIQRGTGQRARLQGFDMAGKTGTTQRARDAWFIGFTSDFVVGVWMGKDDNTPLVGVTGGGLPAEIWRETMRELHRGRPPAPIEQPTWIASASDDAFKRTKSVIIESGGDVLQSLFKDLADILTEGARERGVDVRVEWPEDRRGWNND